VFLNQIAESTISIKTDCLFFLTIKPGNLQLNHSGVAGAQYGIVLWTAYIAEAGIPGFHAVDLPLSIRLFPPIQP
jgi:hypothetical protein